MQLTNILAALAMASVGTSYVVDAYFEPDCGGTPKRVNVWKNTCHTGTNGIQSFKPSTLGAQYQKAKFYAKNGCGLGTWTGYSANGSDDNFQLGKCTNVGFSANAMGSSA